MFALFFNSVWIVTSKQKISNFSVENSFADFISTKMFYFLQLDMIENQILLERIGSTVKLVR